MRLTTRTSLAVQALMFCAINPGRIVRKHEIATAYNVSENHLAQVINKLAQRGFVETRRGRSGGMCLARPKEEIGLGTVMRVFESGLPLGEGDIGGASACPLAAARRFHAMLDRAQDAFYASLDEVTIADLVGRPGPGAASAAPRGASGTGGSPAFRAKRRTAKHDGGGSSAAHG